MTFKNLLDSEESDDKAVTAMGILTNFDTMISVIESKEVSMSERLKTLRPGSYFGTVNLAYVLLAMLMYLLPYSMVT